MACPRITLAHLIRRLQAFLFLALFIIAPIAVAQPSPGLMVLVGKHRLHLDCRGIGRPTVILDAGLGGNSLDWIRVQPGIAAYTRVCVYDRAGYGWSETGPRPRTSARIVRELRTLLDTAAVEGPYILVGHSFGGYNMQLFASNYPDDTAGVVLVDSSHAEQYERFRTSGVEVHTAPGRNFQITLRPNIPPNLPADVQTLAMTLAGSMRTHNAIISEMSSLLDSAREVRSKNFPGNVPLTVITRSTRVWPDTPKGERMEAIWQELQSDLVSHSSNASQVFAHNSGHHVHLDEPNLVIDSVRNLVIASRRRLANR